MIGPHVIGSVSEYRDLIRRWQPRAALLVDPSAGAAASVKGWSPGTFLVGRVYRPDAEIERRILDDPPAAAAWAAGLIKPVAAQNPDVSVWQFNNEICQNNPAEIARLAEFSQEYIRLLAAAGLRVAIGGFSVGRPEAPPNDQGACWNAFAPAMRAGIANNGVLLLHAYGRPRIFGDPHAPQDSPPEWYLQRYEHVVRPFLPADIRDMPYIYGEYGCDLRTGHEGWRTGYRGDLTAYAEDLQRAAEFLARQLNCLGACVFTLGTVSLDWVDFDVRGDVAEALAARPWPSRPKRGAAMHPHAFRPRQPTAAPAFEGAAIAPPEAQRLFKAARAKPLVDYRAKPRLLERLVADGFIAVSQEFSVKSGVVAYLAQAAAHPVSGEERVYYAPRSQPDDVRHLVQ